MSSRPWSNEKGFEKNFERERQQNRNNSYKTESNSQKRQEPYIQPSPQSGNFLQSMFADPSERETSPVERSISINKEPRQGFSQPLQNSSNSRVSLDQSQSSSTAPRVMNKALQNILHRMQSRQTTAIPQQKSFNTQTTIPQILDSPQIQRSQQIKNQGLGFSQLAANQGIQAKAKPVLTRRENQSIFRNLGNVNSYPSTGRQSFMPPPPPSPPVLPPVKQYQYSPRPITRSTTPQKWDGRNPRQDIPVPSQTERPSYTRPSPPKDPSRPMLGQFQRLNQNRTSSPTSVFSGTPAYARPTSRYSGTSPPTESRYQPSRFVRPSNSPNMLNIQSSNPMYDSRNNQVSNNYSAQSSALRNSSFLSRPSHFGESTLTGPTRPTRTPVAQHLMEETEIVERLHIIRQSELVKFQILQILSDGVPHVDCHMLRKIKKSGRYLGSVALGMILYNLRELFGARSMTRTYSEGSYIYQLSPEFRQIFFKAFKKAVQKPTASKTVLKTRKTVQKD